MLRDSVQAGSAAVKDVNILIRTHQLQSGGTPQDAEALRQSMLSWAPDAQVKEIQHAGAPRAFEVTYSVAADGYRERVLSFALYGETCEQTLRFGTREELFAKWEPVFRAIAATVRAGRYGEPA